MKHHHIIFTVLFFISAFYNQQVVAQKNTMQPQNNVIEHSKTTRQSYLISGQVTQTSSYCGGARPSQEMLDQIATPVAYPNKKFYIRKGKTNSLNNNFLKSFTTDKDGNFTIRLRKGIYSIILEEQLKEINSADYTSTNQQVDTSCIKEWWSKPYSILEVKNKNITQLNFNFHHRCFVTNDIPCLNYVGPMPP